MVSRTKQGAVFLLLFNLVIVSAAEAAVLAEKGTWERKLQRGFLNAAFSPLEISHALAEEKKEGKAFFGWATALGQGTVFSVARALSAVYDVVTFPLPLPSGYEPVYEPEFSLEYLGLLKEPPAP